MNATPKKASTVSTGRIFAVFWEQIQRRLPAFFALVLMVVVAIVANTVAPIYYKRFFDVLGAGKLDSALIHTAMVALIMAFFMKFVRWGGWRIADFIANPFTAGTMKDLVMMGYERLLGHSYKFFSDTFVGTLTRRLTKFSYAFESIFDQLSYQLVPLVVSSIVIFFVVNQRSPMVAYILFGWMFLMVFANYLVIKWKQKYEEKRSAADSKLSGTLSDSMTNSSTIKLFASSKHEMSLFEAVAEDVRSIRLWTWNIDSLIRTVQGFLTIIVEIAVMFSAFKLYQKGQLTLGDFVLFQTYILTLTEQMWQFGWVLKHLFEAFADAKEMVEIIDNPYDVQDAPGAGVLKVTEGKIDFADVVFNFNETRKVLDGFSLSITPGEKVALIGPSGAGKTTVTRLLFRFHDVTSGLITIDGQDISKVTQDSLRNAIGLVPQEPILFHRSLMDNIRYGRRDATDEEVLEAAKKARCHEFISSLPDGYETMVGERGVKLSGGERQRVAIARAILKDAPILVLDEATSSLDSESEHLIQEALNILMEGKTVIVIAHRLSTIITMDRIIVIEGGNIRAMGTHDELLKKDDLYKKLWSIQAGGFLKEE
ncbi:MAG: ATP-binding cassette, subfamily bacterial [Patescibacteria group bacterium]|nr:ATP-binding cassette, subfamily bacterial [Patescibacteria group bacterium]